MFKNILPSVPEANDLVEMDQLYMLHSTELSCIMYQNGWLVRSDITGVIENRYIGKFMFYYELEYTVKKMYSVRESLDNPYIK